MSIVLLSAIVVASIFFLIVYHQISYSLSSIHSSAQSIVKNKSTSFPVEFKLSTFDWTSLSCLLTAGAIAVSIWSNITSNKALKATIAIQNQNKALNGIGKCISIINEIQKNNSVNINDIHYYFNKDCAELYENWVSDFQDSIKKDKICQSYFQRLRFQLNSEDNDSTNWSQMMADIQRYELLTRYNNNDSCSEPEKQELAELEKHYRLRNDLASSAQTSATQWRTYTDIKTAAHSANLKADLSKRKLIETLHTTLANSLKLHY